MKEPLHSRRIWKRLACLAAMLFCVAAAGVPALAQEAAGDSGSGQSGIPEEWAQVTQEAPMTAGDFSGMTLSNWLEKGGEIRGKLNGIGFAQTLNMEVDSAQHLVVRDVSLQGSRLALPGASQESMPAEIKQELEALDNEWHQQHSAFSEPQKCLFIHSDWLGRIEASLQDVGAQIRQAQQC